MEIYCAKNPYNTAPKYHPVLSEKTILKVNGSYKIQNHNSDIHPTKEHIYHLNDAYGFHVSIRFAAQNRVQILPVFTVETVNDIPLSV